MKNVLIIGVALLLTGCASQAPIELSQTGRSAVPVKVVTVLSVERPVFYKATGTVRARLNTTLSSKVMARITSVPVREGDTVSQGQVLVILDSRELSAGVEVAQANLSASTIGVDNARTAREMEVRTSAARIAQADAAVQQSRAALAAAQSKLDLVLAGPRTQERTQAHLAVVQAESTLRLAKTQLARVTHLVAEGAMPRMNLDEAQNAHDLALGQRDTAVQAEKMAQEGSRSEDIRSAREGVAQAQAAVTQAQANLTQARASALQAKVRAEEIRVAQSQVSQSAAALRSAEVSVGYATVSAPFDGVIVKRTVDPGAMATPGSPLVALEGGELRLEAVVPESVLPRLRLGADVSVRLDALQRDFVAKVVEIVPQGDTASHTFLVKLGLPRSSGVHSGMFGRAQIATGKVKAMQIPASALWQREGLSYVFVINQEGVARLRLVTVGEAAGGAIPVLSGLAPGDRVVAEGRENVTDGAKVAIR